MSITLATTPLQIGPVAVKASCAVKSQVTANDTTLQVPCAIAIKNISGQTQYVIAQTQSASGRGPLPRIQEQSTVTFYPGQVMTLPAPPTGQVWEIVVTARQTVRHLMGDLGDIALVVLGLAAYGGYEVIKQRKTIYHRVKRML